MMGFCYFLKKEKPPYSPESRGSVCKLIFSSCSRRALIVLRISLIFAHLDLTNRVPFNRGVASLNRHTISPLFISGRTLIGRKL